MNPAMLSQAISSLRQQACDDLMSALRQSAPDAQMLTNELGQLLALPVLQLQDLTAWSGAFEALSFVEAVQRRCILLKDDTDAYQFVVTDPFETDQIAWARTRFGKINVSLASAETLDAWLVQIESGMSALGSMGVSGLHPDDAAVSGLTSIMPAESLSLRGIGADESPAIRFVNSTLYDALKIGASDIHLESDPTGLNVKFRIDGVLTAVRRMDVIELAIQSISRIKVMAQLDIAERRVPQDGRLQIGYKGRSVDVRVSIMPSIHGEDAVLRILDREHLAQSLAGLTLAKLGFEEHSQNVIRRLCGHPHGMLLVTGPTGSGKTTTLYAAIAETHQSRDKIITIEDPVEYQLPGILQIPVNERKGLTFAKGLRSILRHDPDKILVGEIRDAETAQIAVQSALTGHLVFTTVHANTVFDVVGRFEQFGIDAYTFASAINGVLAQRLLRRICGNCALDIDPPDAEDDGELAAFLATYVGNPRFVKAVGCEHCRGTGYLGRFALGEILYLNSTIKAMVASRAQPMEIQETAKKSGWRSLRSQAYVAVVQGATTLEEVNRVAV